MGFLSNLFGRKTLGDEPLVCQIATPQQITAALQIILTTRHGIAHMAEMVAFRQQMRARGIDISQIHVAVRGKKPLYAILPTLLPGRALLLASGTPQDAEEAAAGRVLLADVVQQWLHRDIVMIQALIEPEDELQAAIYTSCGFARMADLVYMEIAAREQEWKLPSGIELATYSPERHHEFAHAIEASYENTLDCPALNGVRTIEDVIAAHKAAGEFDPENWLLLRQHGKAAGVLLLTRIPASDAMELVYIGLAPSLRGLGIASELLKRAISVAARSRCARLTTAVDSRNSPAISLYRRGNMSTIGTRSAYVRVVHATR